MSLCPHSPFAVLVLSDQRNGGTPGRGWRTAPGRHGGQNPQDSGVREQSWEMRRFRGRGLVGGGPTGGNGQDSGRHYIPWSSTEGAGLQHESGAQRPPQSPERAGGRQVEIVVWASSRLMVFEVCLEGLGERRGHSTGLQLVKD